MCIDHDYYVCGTNEDYEHMLNWIDRLYPNPVNMYFIAEDIRKNSANDLLLKASCSFWSVKQ